MLGAVDQDLVHDIRFVEKKLNAKAWDIRWPHLCNDIENAFIGCIFVYGVAGRRAFARRPSKKGAEVKGDPILVEKALNLPTTQTEMIKVFNMNV